MPDSRPSREELNAVARLREGLRRFTAATEAATERHGLTPRWYDLLAVIHGSPGRTLTAHELTERLVLSRSAVSELVTRAAQAGLVVRRPDPRDDRRKSIRPTAEGTRRYLDAMTALRPEREHLLQMLARVTDEAELLVRIAGGDEPGDRAARRRARP